MRIENTTPIKIVAETGMVLTNGEAYSTAGGYITLGVNDSPDNWSEITVEEAEKLQNEVEEATTEDYQEALSKFGVNTDE